MYPIITKIGPFTLHTFGVMLALAILVGSWWLVRETRRLGDPRITEDKIQKLVWWIVVGIVLGGRIMYCIVEIARGNGDRFLSQPWTMLYVWEGGLVMYGGFIGVFIGVVTFARINKIRILRLCDLAAPACFLGQSIGRWGCLFAGDDYGKPAPGLPWAITFPERPGTLIPDALIGVPLHPVQIYMSMKAFAIFLFLTWLTRRKRFDGQVAGWAFISYAILRTIVELFRGDADRGILTKVGSWAISTATFTSLLTFFLGLGILLLAPRRSLRDDLGSPQYAAA